MIKLPKGVIDLRKPLKGYTGKWVVLSKDQKKVVESANSLESLIKKGQGKWKDGIMMRVAKDYSNYIG